MITSLAVSLHPWRSTTVAALGAAAAIALAGCAQGSANGTPRLSGVPLAPGTRVLAHVRRCDAGDHPYCAIQLVLSGRSGQRAGGYRSSAALLAGEALHLRHAGWGAAQGDTIHESAAESPGQKLRVTYATASEDLLSIDEGTIKRAGSIARSLSGQMFARAPALSLMLQAGSS